MAAALFLGSCREEPGPAQGDGGGPATVHVGFSQIGAESAWRTAETQSIRSEAEKRGVHLSFADAQGRHENQIKALRNFIAQNVDAIILAPVVETGWEPVLREIRAADIPVVLVDRGVEVSDESLYATIIASDFVEEGRMAARWLVEKTGGAAAIVEITGTTGSAPAIDRERGFHEIVDQHEGMTVTKSQSGDFTRSGGKQVMEAFLKADRDDIDAVYAHNDDMALGAIQAIEEAGLAPGVDILIISIDAVHDAFQAMIDGKLNATVECNPLLGPMAFDAVDAILRGEEPPKRITVEDRLFDQSTAAADIGDRKY
jgi:simple sugar transport system substrate-binding protein